MMTMKEACEYVKNSRLAKAKKHRLEVTKGDYCAGLTTKENNRWRCLLYTSPSPRDRQKSRMPSSA